MNLLENLSVVIVKSQVSGYLERVDVGVGDTDYYISYINIVVVCIFILLSLPNNIYIYNKYFLYIKKVQELESERIRFNKFITQFTPLEWSLCVKPPIVSMLAKMAIVDTS